MDGVYIIAFEKIWSIHPLMAIMTGMVAMCAGTIAAIIIMDANGYEWENLAPTVFLTNMVTVAFMIITMVLFTGDTIQKARIAPDVTLSELSRYYEVVGREGDLYLLKEVSDHNAK